MDHWRNQKGNKTIPRFEWKWKHNDPKPMGYSKKSSKNLTSTNKRNLKQTITLHLKQLEKEEKQILKLEGKKS